MDVFYINLADQADRRRKLESNFQAANVAQWPLRRVEAVSSQAASQTPGRLGGGEKGCFQSHIKAIEMAKQSPGHVLIAEDDILFGNRSLQAIEAALALVPEDSWDVIFTDVCITNSHAMLDLLMLRRRAASEAPFKLINLSRMPFAGSTAYIVNAKSKDKILTLLSQSGPLEFPYDVFLQRAVHDNKLRAFVTFPFVTGLSFAAESSQINQSPNRLEAAMNAFRRLMWLERDIGTASEALDGAGMDEETAAFLKILAVFLAPDVTPT